METREMDVCHKENLQILRVLILWVSWGRYELFILSLKDNIATTLSTWLKGTPALRQEPKLDGLMSSLESLGSQRHVHNSPASPL